MLSKSKVKNVVLNRAYSCISETEDRVEIECCTETKVAGKNAMVSNAIDFMIVLSCWAIILKAYECKFLFARV